MYKFKITLSDFHGGGLVGHHKTAQAALKTYKRLSRGADCVCGCYTVTAKNAADDKELLSAIDPATGNPYFYK